MIEWVMVICIAAGAMGCGVFQEARFDTKEECFEALAHVRVFRDSKHTVALCKPVRREK